MAIAITALTAFNINSGADATSYTGASDTPPTTGILVLATSSRNASSLNTPTISAFGLTWTQIGSTINNSTGLAGNGVAVFRANAAGASAGAVTVDYGANTQLGCVASLIHITGVDTAAPIVQSVTANDGGVAGTTGTITLAAASHADNRPVAVINHLANQDSEPRANWTELSDQAGGGHARSTNVQWRSDTFETTATNTWATSSGWSGIAFEVKASVAAAAKAYPFMPRPLRVWEIRR